MKTAKTLILLALLGAGILFANNILAATEVADSPCNTTIVFNSPIPNQTYNVGDVINFSGKFRVTSCGDGLFHNKIEFFITEDKEIPIKNRNCCGDCCGAISNIYGGCIQNITWCGDVKILDIAQADGYKIYKLGTIYPPDIPTGFNPYWVPYDQYFTIPSDLGFWGPVRFYVQYSGTHWNAHWHWNITYQKGEINYPPHAAISCDPSDCGTTDCIAYTGCPFHLINNSTDPNGQADIIKSEWDIYNWGADPDLSCSGICNFTPQTLILTPGTYTVELLVQDKAGASDTETITFYLLQEAMSGFMCSLDNLNWKTCEGEEIKPSINQVVYFKDDPSLTEHSLSSQEATSIISRTWKINGNIFDSDNNPNPSTNLNLRSNIVELIITDNLGRTASKTHTIRATLPLPQWKEIPP